MSEQDPSQGSLFEVKDSIVHSPTTEPASHEVRTDSTFEPAVDGVFPANEAIYRLADDNPGPHVSILERNQELGKAINKLASISRAEGFKKADTIPGVRDEIAGRYGTGYDEVRENTVSKSDRVATEVPVDFAQAWGLAGVVDKGAMSESDAEAAMTKDYSRFEAWYGGPQAGADRREAKKRWLNYQKRTLAGERTRRPKVKYPRHPNSN